jgi:hypothetical protein
MTGRRDVLRLIWEQYLLDGEPTPLLAFIEAHPESMTACSHEYPHMHRICDIILNEKAFRVTRCVSCGEELSFPPITSDIAQCGGSGVPYWLSGAKLSQWVEDVTSHDPEEAADWHKYR